MTEKIKEIVIKELKENSGILQMKPCWVSRDYLPSGKRLGLKDEEYRDSNRGEICERWLVSETQADNKYYLEHEGQSHLSLKTSNDDVLLSEALEACPAEILGDAYSKKHKGLDRLLKIFDYKTRLFFHYHHREADARLVGRQSKEEAYYFLEADVGSHPETFFGVHPYIVKDNLQKELLLPIMKKWEGEEILKYSRAYLNIPGDGFHLAAGILHAPGTALTLELQESSDVMAILQADIQGIRMSKHLMFKDIPEKEVKEKQEEAVLDRVDWVASGDPYFYENHHLGPRPIVEELPEGIVEEWVWYNSTKFSGTRVTVQPGASFISKALGVHGIFVWSGEGLIDNFHVTGQKVSRSDSDDEYLITHEKALNGVSIRNTGNIPLTLFKFFGPNINDSIVPFIKKT
jgi:hypothetical protein